MKIYNKLVRDNIEEIMLKKGLKPITRILSDEEYIQELNKKLKEEVNEYLESQDIEEIADIEEVLLSILKFKKIDKKELETIRLEKAAKRGSFDKKLFLEREED